MSSAKGRLPILLAGVVMMLFSGVLYTWSILKVPLEGEFGWSGAQTGVNYTVTMACFCIGMLLAGFLASRGIRPRVNLLLGAALAFLGYTLTSFLQAGIPIALLCVVNGALCGLGVGFVYNTLLATVTAWYPDRQATASGALMMGFGASALVFGALMELLFSTIGWRWAFRALGLSILIVIALGSIWIKQKPKDGAAAKGAIPAQGYSPIQMLRRASFWMFFVQAILLAGIGNFVIGFGKDIAVNAGAASALAVTLVGVLSVANGLSRIGFGRLFDTLGRRKAMILSSACSIAATALLLAATALANVPLAIAGIVMLGVAYGSIPPINSGFIASSYGREHFAVNFSLANGHVLLAAMFPAIGGAIMGATGGYSVVFICLIACAALALVVNISLKKI